MSEKIWHFLDVNRGRYLCSYHGSFCDDGDGFSTVCPLCRTNSSEDWEPNRVHRSLQVVKNLQGRSQRSITVLTGSIGLLSVFTFLGAKAQETQALEITAVDIVFLVSAFVFSLVSVGLYLLSMVNVAITKKGQFLSQSLQDWEDGIAKIIGGFEKRHGWAGAFFTLGLMSLVAAAVSHLF